MQRPISTLLVLLSTSVSLAAQWLNYPTKGFRERRTENRIFQPRLRGQQTANQIFPEFGKCRRLGPGSSSILPPTIRANPITACPIDQGWRKWRRPGIHHPKRANPIRSVYRTASWCNTPGTSSSEGSSRPRNCLSFSWNTTRCIGRSTSMGDPYLPTRIPPGAGTQRGIGRVTH